MNSRKILLTTLLFLFFWINPAFALETKYPKAVFGPLPGLSEFLKYIVEFAIGIVGIVAFLALVFAGIKYLTSTGDTERMKDAKKQITSAFLGVILLLFSYLILKIINPQLVSFEIPGLKKAEKINIVIPPLDKSSPQYLIRVQDLLQETLVPLLTISDSANKIKELTDKCSCKFSQPQCACSGQKCQALKCFLDPCQERKSILAQKRAILAKNDEISYYRQRLISEREDMGPELQFFESGDVQKLDEKFSRIISKIPVLIEEDLKLIDLPERCSVNLCIPSCKQTSCHDGPGCLPDKCFLPFNNNNPCPLSDIASQLSNIEREKREIENEIKETLSLLPGLEIIEFPSAPDLGESPMVAKGEIKELPNVSFTKSYMKEDFEEGKMANSLVNTLAGVPLPIVVTETTRYHGCFPGDPCVSGAACGRSAHCQQRAVDIRTKDKTETEKQQLLNYLANQPCVDDLFYAGYPQYCKNNGKPAPNSDSCKKHTNHIHYDVKPGC